MNERIKELRKTLGLTLEAFGEKIGISKSAASKIEKGKSGVTEQTVKLICSEFGVNEDWLRYGKGNDDAMFCSENKNIVESLSTEYKLTDLEKAIVTTFLELDSDTRAAITEYVKNLVEKLPDSELPTSERIRTESHSLVKSKESELEDDSAKFKPAISEKPISPYSYAEIVRQLEDLKHENEQFRLEYEKTQRDNAELRKQVEAIQQEDALREDNEIKSDLSMVYGQS